MKPIPSKFIKDRNILKGPSRKEPKNLAAYKIRETLLIFEVSQKCVADELNIPYSNLIDYMQNRRTPSLKTACKIKEYFYANFSEVEINCEDWIKRMNEE